MFSLLVYQHANDEKQSHLPGEDVEKLTMVLLFVVLNLHSLLCESIWIYSSHLKISALRHMFHINMHSPVVLLGQAGTHCLPKFGSDMGWHTCTK
jgi:hypothetical protein